MSELSDLALGGICAVALFLIYLLRVLWGRESTKAAARQIQPSRQRRHVPNPRKPRSKGRNRQRRKPAGSKTRVIVDGSNVMHWGGDPSHLVLKHVIQSLQTKGFEPHVIFDANVGYKLGNHYMDDAPMAQLLHLPEDRVLVVEKGVAADEWILKVATEENVQVVSNDRFRDWKVQYPIVGKKGRILRGTWKSGNVIWDSL